MPARSLVVVLLLAAAAPAAEPGWETSLPAALAKAKQTGRPVLIDFHADWCGPCQKLAASFRDPQVAAVLSRGFVAVKVNADTDPALTEKYRATGLPTLVVVSPEGQELARASGARSAAELVTWLSAVPKPKPAAPKPPAGDDLGRRLEAIHAELAKRL